MKSQIWKYIGIAVLVGIALYFLFRWLSRNKNGSTSGDGSSRTNATSCNKLAAFCANNPEASWCWDWYQKTCGAIRQTVSTTVTNTNSTGEAPVGIGNITTGTNTFNSIPRPTGPIGLGAIGYGGPRPTQDLSV